MGNYFLDKYHGGSQNNAGADAPETTPQPRNYFLDKYHGGVSAAPAAQTPAQAGPTFSDRLSNSVYNAADSAGAFVKGAVEGATAANPIDMGINVGNYINQKISQATGRPIPQHGLRDIIPDAVAQYLPEDFEHRGFRGGVQDRITGPVDPQHSTAHRIGEFTGGFLAPGGIVRTANAANNIRKGANVASEVGNVLRGGGQDALAGTAAVGAATVASPVLGVVGEKVGGMVSPEAARYGRVAGEVVGDFAVPSAAARSVLGLTPQRTAQKIFADEQSPERLTSSKRAGVVPSVGLVGNDRMAKLEDYLASPTYSAGPIRDRRSEQFGQMDKFASDVAQLMRGGPGTQVGRIDKSTLGLGAQELGRTIEGNVDNKVSALQEGIIDKIKNVHQQAIADEAAAAVAEGRPTPQYPGSLGKTPFAPVDELLAEIDAIKKDASLSSAQKRYVSSIEQGLHEDIQTMMGGPSPRPGVGYEALKAFRTDIGKRMADGGKIDAIVKKRLYDAATKDMQTAADKFGGVLPEEFDRVQSETRAHYASGAKSLADKLQNPKEGSAANVLFSPTNMKSPSQLETASRYSHNAQGENMLRPVLADSFELGVRGAGAGVTPPSPETFSPKELTSYWAGVPDRARDVMFSQGSSNMPNMGGRIAGPVYDGQLAKKVEDLIAVAEADKRRPSRSLPSGGNSVTGPVTTFGPLLGALGGAVTSSPTVALASLASMVGMRGLAQLMTNPKFAEYIAAPPVPVTANPHSQKAAAGAMSAMSDHDRNRRNNQAPVPVELPRININAGR